MTHPKEYLKPHGLYENQTFEEFFRKVPHFFFKKCIPDDVIKNFEIVHKLCVYSYFEHQFSDEAFLKALHTFEMAMKMRYSILNSEKALRELSFDFLIKRLSSLHIFEANLMFLETVKSLRNSYSHPERHSFSGTNLWSAISLISRLINEMYEDIPLRTKRKAIVKTFIRNLKKYQLNRYALVRFNNEEIPVFDVRLLFVNNKYKPVRYFLTYTPLFYLRLNPDGSHNLPLVYELDIFNAEFGNGILQAKELTTQLNIEMIAISNASLFFQEVVKHWRYEYENSGLEYMYESAINFHSSNYFVTIMEEFQQM